MEFVVEEDIDNAVEIGYDGFTIDGQFPDSSFWGIEIKDKAYIIKTVNKKELPKQVSFVNDRLAETLKKFRYRNFWSTELRIKNKIPYFIDPCCRCGSPPSELYQDIYLNLADIMWNGADGVLVEPQVEVKYGAELLLHSSWADKNWQAVQFPKKLRGNIKLRNLAIIDKEYYIVPQNVGIPEIGSVMAFGESMEESIEKVKEMAKEVTGYYIEVYPDSLDTAIEEVDKIEKALKIKF